MTNEAMLEYLSLRQMMDCNMCASWENDYSIDKEMWFSNGIQFEVDLKKIKQRLFELEAQIINPYVIDTTSKED